MRELVVLIIAVVVVVLAAVAVTAVLDGLRICRLKLNRLELAFKDLTQKVNGIHALLSSTDTPKEEPPREERFRAQPGS